MWPGDNDSSRIATADAARFRERRRELGLGPLVIHDNYLINLASPERVLRARSVQAFHGEIGSRARIGSGFSGGASGRLLRTHPSDAIAAIADGLRQAARGLKLGGLRILLENTAGQGSSVGSQFSELKAIMDLCRELPMGVCIDTAHIFAAGHNIPARLGSMQTLERMEAAIGLANIYVIHVNDSKTGLARAWIGTITSARAKLASRRSRAILNHRHLAGRAFILETPIDKPGDDRRNVVALWKLLGKDVPAGGGRKSWHKCAISAVRTRKRASRLYV